MAKKIKSFSLSALLIVALLTSAAGLLSIKNVEADAPVITGIKVEVKASAGGGEVFNVQLLKEGTLVGSAKNLAVPNVQGNA